MTAIVLESPNTPLHRTRLSNWFTPNVGNVVFYSGYRVTGPNVIPGNILIGQTANAAGTSIVDNEELPNGVQFTYWVKGNLNAVADCNSTTPAADCTGATNTATITAVNAAPVAVADSYTTIWKVPSNPLPVLSNDTDVDSPATSLKAVVTVLPTKGTLKVNPDGSFAYPFVYTPTGNNFGLDSFKYRANDGTWSRDPSQPMSENSNEVTVTINIVKK